MAEKIKFIINGQEVEGKAGEKILDVAKRYDIKIPHLCMNERLPRIASCRLCVVEVKGFPKLVASCSTPIRGGMEVTTNSTKVIKARRINIELLLANHDCSCLTCSQNLNCQLQKYAHELGIRDIRFSGAKRKFEIDDSSVSIRRNNNKCILCGQCFRVCNELQTVYAIGQNKRGFDSCVTTPFNLPLSESSCVNCGQCVIACPVGALSEKSDIGKALDLLKSNKFVVVQTAPSIRAALGECFGMKPGTPVTGKMVAALRQLGFDRVFDTDMAADMTIVEEATEFVHRFTENKNLPMITTCCPAWIKFAEQFYFEQLGHMSSCKSPQAMMASIIKTYYAKKIGKKPEDIAVIDIMPCTAKKFEADRAEFNGDTDLVLTTVELAKLIDLHSINFTELEDEEFDNPLGESTGAGVIFGRSGGVMEAALRTAADFVTGKDIKNVEYTQVRGMETLKEATLNLAGKEIKIGVVHTLGEARKIMDQIRDGTSPYHFIEIMACYGGCIGGGGQPRPKDNSILKKRMSALAKEDTSKKIRKSHKNPSLIKIYDEYIGEFGGKKAHKLLHTKYFEREFI